MFYRTLVITISALLASFVCRGQGYTVSTIAGGGANQGTDGLGDGGPAAKASLSGNGYGLAVDSAGNLYISDNGNNLIRKVAPDGTITVVAGDVKGNGGGYYGDGGPAIGAGLNTPYGIAVDPSGNLYIADYGNARVRKVSTNGNISTVAGGGTNVSFGGQATQTLLRLGPAIAVDSAGDIFLQYVNGSGASDQVLKVTTDGLIHEFAGDPSAAFGSLGDGGPATKAFMLLSGLTLDSAGNLYIADRGDNLIRKVDTSGTITSIAGNNTANYSGDGGPALKAGINMPSAIAVDGGGNFYIDDFENYRIRKITPDLNINTIAGNGTPGSSGDNGPATSAEINFSLTLTLGNDGSVYFTDSRASDGASVVRQLKYNAPEPAINTGGVVPVFSSATTIQPGEWVSIFGSNLASTTAIWNGNFPTSLGGTSVTIDGQPAYLWYVSPTQINLQAPDDMTVGSVNVVVTTPGGNATSTVTLGQFGPSFNLLDAKHVAGIILRPDGSGAYGSGNNSYDIVGPTGTSLGYKTVAAKAGDILELFGVGFGPTSPTVQAGKAYSGAAATTNPVQLFIKNAPVTPQFAGIVEAGLYQINVQIPSGLGAGDVSLQAQVSGFETPSGVVISLQ